LLSEGGIPGLGAPCCGEVVGVTRLMKA